MLKFGVEMVTLWEWTVDVVEEGFSALETISTSIKMVGVLVVVMELIVELFFLFRLWRLSKSLVPTLIGLLLLLTACILGFVALARAYATENQLISASQPTNRTITALAFGAHAMCDAWISGLVVICLRSQRNINRSRIHSVLDKLILWTLETGICTSFVVTITLVAYLLFGSTNSMNGRWIVQAHLDGDDSNEDIMMHV